MRAERHPREEERLSALRAYGILDTPREKDFDDIVALAAKTCETSVAFISLIDEGRQWFKAEIGLDVDQTDLEGSMCAHTILDGGFVHVENMTADVRSSDLASVKGPPGLRFYASVCLRTEDGLPIGTLGVADVRPRTLSELQSDMLRVLGRQVMVQLELRRKVLQLEAERAERIQREQLLSLVTDRLPVRVGYLDRDYRFKFINGAYERAFNLAPGSGIGKSVEELAGKQAFEIAHAYLDRALAGETHTQEFTVPYPFGVRRIEAQYVAAPNEQGNVEGVVVHVADVTDRFNATEALREREERYRTLFTAIEEGFCVLEMIFDAAGKPVDYRFREFNPAFSLFTGIRAEDALGGKTARELYPTLEEHWFEIYGRVAITGESAHFENEAVAMGKWFDVRAFRIGGQGSVEVGLLFQEITQRRLAQAAIEGQRARQDRTLETAQVATFDWDVANDLIYANPLLHQFFGFVGVEGEGLPLSRYMEAVHPEDRQAVTDALMASHRDGGRYEVLYRVIDAAGRERHVLTRGETTLGTDGKAIRVSGVVLDVTARAQAEDERERLVAELRVEQEKLQTLFEQAPAFIAVLRGPELRFEYVNEGYYQLVGHRQVVGLTLAEALPEAVGGGSGRDYDRVLRSVLETGERLTFQSRPVVLRRTSEGPLEERFVDLSYQALREADGTITGVLAHGIDVTDQTRARQEIAAREELFRTVFESAPDDAIIVMDADRTITTWNPAASRICGWSVEEAVGQPADLIFTPEDRAQRAPESEVAVAARDGKTEDERWHLRKDGTRFWGSGTMNSLHHPDGSVRGYLKVFRDATERYEETQTLSFLRWLTDAIIDQREPDRIIETAERMVGQYLGASRVTFGEFAPDEESFVVRTEWGPEVPSVVGTHALTGLGATVIETLRSGQTYVVRDAEQEFRDMPVLEVLHEIKALAGVTVPVMKEGRLTALVVAHNATPREWTKGEIGLVQQVADRLAAEIERARAEEALRFSEERFRQLVDLSPATVWFGETDGGLSYISQDFYETTGLTPEEALPNGWVSAIDPRDLAIVAADWEVARRDGTRYDTEFRIRNRDGVYRWVSARALPVRNAGGEIIGWLGSNSDIQERKSMEEMLQARIEERTVELQNAVKEAEGFNYSISHDLRAPLRAMSSTASILLEEAGPALSAEHREMLVRQAENANRLGRLIDELLRLSRLARVAVRREPLDMSRKARAVAEELHQSGMANDCRIEVQEGMTGEGDPGLVRTVLQNLIGNACKFSPPGSTVEVGATEGVYWVRDHGVGFDMKFAPKIFLPFERLVSEAEFPGTGIGLANVKRIVERHGGRVWVESETGNGATFSFTLG